MLLQNLADDVTFKLGDFSVAVRTTEAIDVTTLQGTVGYMAPEVLLRQPYGERFWMQQIFFYNISALSFTHTLFHSLCVCVYLCV